MNDTTRMVHRTVDPDSVPEDTAVIHYRRSHVLPTVRAYLFAAVATSRTYGEHLVVIDHTAIDDPAVRYDPICRDVAHEQLGPLPPDIAAKIARTARHRCGRPNRHGNPCRVPVTAQGDACAWHDRRPADEQ